MSFSLSLTSRRDRKTSARRHPRTFQPGLQPALEGLEARTMLSAAAAAAPAAQVAPPVQASKINVLPQLNVTNVTVVNNTLNAVVALGNQVINVPLTLTAEPNPADPACPILNLELNAIELNLLGLNVETSDICLSITAYEGGGLLGDLLCGVSNLLNDGSSLGNILGGLTQSNLSTVLNGLTGLLNGALGAATTTGAPGTATGSTGGTSGAAAGACDILNLSLGPVDLTLLGLNVHLDDCDNGPVTVDITAVPGGGLLGNLLCGLTDSLNLNLNQVTRLLGSLGNFLNNPQDLASLTARVDDILEDGVVTQKEFQGLRKLIRNFD